MLTGSRCPYCGRIQTAPPEQASTQGACEYCGRIIGPARRPSRLLGGPPVDPWLASGWMRFWLPASIAMILILSLLALRFLADYGRSLEEEAARPIERDAGDAFAPSR